MRIDEHWLLHPSISIHEYSFLGRILIVNIVCHWLLCMCREIDFHYHSKPSKIDCSDDCHKTHRFSSQIRHRLSSLIVNSFSNASSDFHTSITIQWLLYFVETIEIARYIYAFGSIIDRNAIEVQKDKRQVDWWSRKIEKKGQSSLEIDSYMSLSTSHLGLEAVEFLHLLLSILLSSSFIVVKWTE